MVRERDQPKSFGNVEIIFAKSQMSFFNLIAHFQVSNCQAKQSICKITSVLESML